MQPGGRGVAALRGVGLQRAADVDVREAHEELGVVYPEGAVVDPRALEAALALAAAAAIMTKLGAVLRALAVASRAVGTQGELGARAAAEATATATATTAALVDELCPHV